MTELINKQNVLDEIVRFSTEEGSSVECQQLYCDVNNMSPYISMEDEYTRGLNEAWEFIQKLLKDACDGGYTVSLLQNALGYCNISDIVRHYDISEAITKIKEYEKKQKQDTKIRVGDEVILNGNASYENEKAIILAYDGSNYPYNVLMSNGDTEWIKENSIECKTNRHFSQIAEVLAEMRGEE